MTSHLILAAVPEHHLALGQWALARGNIPKAQILKQDLRNVAVEARAIGTTTTGKMNPRVAHAGSRVQQSAPRFLIDGFDAKSDIHTR